jgi:D-erythrose 4-phosphate dehydrogenase
MTLRIAINGFGRIGRSVLRALYETGAHKNLQMVAINEPADAATIAHLLKYDSTHGRFRGGITLLAQTDWQQLPWRALNIDLVLDCSGECHDRLAAQQHLEAGAQRVLVSQPLPLQEVDFTVVLGTNEAQLQKSQRVVSTASCTTQGAVPIIELLDKKFGIDMGAITTIHSTMNDQPVIDAYHHTDLRKTRAASRSIIPIDTSLAKGVGRILPHLEGRFTAQHLRVPTTNVSALDLTVLTRAEVNIDVVNAVLQRAAEQMPALIGYSDEPLASCDFNHDPRSAIVDASQTSVAAGRLVKVLIWFDNEWAYANRMIDVAGLMGI